MGWNLLLWKWSDEFDTPAKRKKSRLKFSDVTAAYLSEQFHPAMGKADIDGCCGALGEKFGFDEDTRPIIVTQYPHCIVVSGTLSTRIDLMPKVADVGRRFSMNAAEF